MYDVIIETLRTIKYPHLIPVHPETGYIQDEAADKIEHLINNNLLPAGAHLPMHLRVRHRQPRITINRQYDMIAGKGIQIFTHLDGVCTFKDTIPFVW